MFDSIPGRFKYSLQSMSIDDDSISSLSSNFKDIFIATLVTVSIFLLPLFFYVSGISIVGVFEEAVGYRYFYSLRIAFGHEHPWMVQGQLVTIYHVLLQYILTALGLPNNQLYPRVDIFSMFANIPLILLTWFSFRRLSKSLSFKSLSLLVAAIFIFMMQSNNLPGGLSWPLTPDYAVWVLPLAIFSASLLPKNMMPMSQRSRPSLWFLKFGFLIGIAGGIKITYILFPCSVLIAIILNDLNWREIPKALFITALSSIFTLSFIFWASTGFAGKAVLQNNLALTLSFYKHPNPVFLADGQIISETLLPLLFSLIAFCLGCIKKNWGLTSIGVMGLIYSVFVCQRFYSHSLIEYHAFTLIPLIALIRIYGYHLTKVIRRQIMLVIVLCPALVILVIASMHVFPILRDTPDYYRRLSLKDMEFHKRLTESSRPIWILTTNNAYRPNSIESAMCKGGMDVGHGRWGDSPYIAQLFPTFHCIVDKQTLSQEDKQSIALSTIGFAHAGDESLQSAIERVEKTFDISLNNAVCQDVPGKDTTPLSYCYPKQFAHTAY